MKKKAFVKYTQKGKIVPGGLIITEGAYPNGPGKWYEVPINLFCCEPITTTTTTVPTTPFLVQENGDLILQEDSSRILI